MLHQLFLHPDATLLLVSFLIADHLEVLDFGLRSWREALLHTLAGCLKGTLELLSLVLIFDDIGLTHRELGDRSFHLAGQVP